MLALFRRSNKKEVGALYNDILAAARKPVLYDDYGVPDTPIGRFQMIALHSAPHIIRLGRDNEGRNAQMLFDMIFRDVEFSFREIGVGDLAVPKRMKKWMKDFNGVVQAHAAANADHVEITRRNVFGDDARLSTSFQTYINKLFEEE